VGLADDGVVKAIGAPTTVVGVGATGAGDVHRRGGRIHRLDGRDGVLAFRSCATLVYRRWTETRQVSLRPGNKKSIVVSAAITAPARTETRAME
jgi:hypothetical protein